MKKNYYGTTEAEVGGLTILGVIALIVIFIFIEPWLFFWLAYFGGWIAKITIGKYLVEGFAILGISVPIGKIPLIAGVLGWIGGFFKNISTSNFNKK